MYHLRRSSLNSWLRLLVTIVGGVITTPSREDHGHHSFKFWHTLLQTVNILIVHAPPASFAESLIGFGSLLSTYHNGVLSKALKVLFEHFLQSLSASHQGYEHEYSPEHAESSEEASRLVASNRVDYFSICIYIYPHNLNLLLAPRWGGFYLLYRQE